MANKSFFQNNNDSLSKKIESSGYKFDPNSKSIKGETLYTDNDGKLFIRGFTPPVSFITDIENKDPKTGNPIELGVEIINNDTPRNVNDILNTDIPEAYDAFPDDPGFEFLHHLDKDIIPSFLELKSSNDIYLTSFIETDTDNEDPVMFGYDVVIDYDNSPLFNGALEEFLSNGLFSSYTELTSRIDLVNKFKKQLFKFFSIRDANHTLGNLIPDNYITRTYYLKKIAGLDNLTEKTGADKPKQFVAYGTDVITLTLNEDVSVNMGYLASLYKTLTYSKLHGKKMIPDNLLRFDMQIIVTEVRKFNRVYRNKVNNSIFESADGNSKYRYKLYECQMFFDRFSHEDSIDMSQLAISDGFDIKINYKYSTLNFEKFLDKPSILSQDSSGNYITRTQDFINNAKLDLKLDKDVTGMYDSNYNTLIIQNGSIAVVKDNARLKVYKTYTPLPDQFVEPDLSSYLGQVVAGGYGEKLKSLDLQAKNSRKNSLNSLLTRTANNIKNNVKSSFNNSLTNALNTLQGELEAFIPTNLVGGFTEDGWQYNIPAYYTNKVLNVANNSLRKTLQTVRADIYSTKTKYQVGFLENINQFINQGNNLLNNALGKLPGAIDKILTGDSAGANPKNKPSDIYGNGSAQPITYSGAYSALPDKGYEATQNNSGFGKDGFEYNLPVWNSNHRGVNNNNINNNNNQQIKRK